jgi:hypothetical protein
MSDSDNVEAWHEYGDKLLGVCSGVFDQAQFAEEDKTLSNAKVIALALLCRTATNFSALKLLVEEDFVVEARTLARSCYENLFWIGGLAGQGQEFVDKIVHHNDVNKIKTSQQLLQWAKKQNEPIQFETDLDTFLTKLKAETATEKAVDFKSAADAGKVGDAYIIYRVLSTDAAHPSAMSLNHFVNMDMKAEDFDNPDAEWTPIQIDGEDPGVKKAVSSLEDIIEEVRSDNGYNSTHPHERDHILEGLQGTLEKFKSSSISAGYVRIAIERLGTLGRRFGGTLKEGAIAAAKGALIEFAKKHFGELLSYLWKWPF